MTKDSTLVLESQDVYNRLKRMSWEVLEKHNGAKRLLLAGISDQGFELAKRIEAHLKTISKLEIKCIKLEINKDQPYEENLNAYQLADIKDFKEVVVLDDVLNSGKTLIYAVKSFLGKPLDRLSTLVLVDRNHNRYPIKADIIGLSLATTLQEHVSVEFGKEDRVYLS